MHRPGGGFDPDVFASSLVEFEPTASGLSLSDTLVESPYNALSLSMTKKNTMGDGSTIAKMNTRNQP